MSVYTVTRDDFTNVRRSSVVLGVIAVFTVLVALVFGALIDYHDYGYRSLWDVSFLVALVLPLIAAPLTYLSIAGDRTSGAITFSLGLPNSRRSYFLGKYLSRVTVAVAAVAVSTAVGFLVATLTFTNGADPVRFLVFVGVSGLYATAIAGTFVAISALTASRSRAMFGVLAAYFLLVLFWGNVLPVVQLNAVLDAVASALGVTLSQWTRDMVSVLSPMQAYLLSTEFVYAGVLDRHDVFAVFTEDPDALPNKAWFAVVVLVAWSVLAPLAGYLGFRRAELG